MQNVTSASKSDWHREEKNIFEWAPSRSLLAAIRSYQKNQSKRYFSSLARKIAVLRHKFWSVVTGADVPINARIAGGLVMPHPNGIVIHSEATVGPNCLIFQQVTLGMRRGGTPRIGGDVNISAGAKILGSVEIGDHAIIGANAVVLDDVPPYATAIGVPARIISRDTNIEK